MIHWARAADAQSRDSLSVGQFLSEFGDASGDAFYHRVRALVCTGRQAAPGDDLVIGINQAQGDLACSQVYANYPAIHKYPPLSLANGDVSTG
jgi:hypothetical protein